MKIVEKRYGKMKIIKLRNVHGILIWRYELVYYRIGKIMSHANKSLQMVLILIHHIYRNGCPHTYIYAYIYIYIYIYREREREESEWKRESGLKLGAISYMKTRSGLI